jgi:hypothetical protein
LHTHDTPSAAHTPLPEQLVAGSQKRKHAAAVVLSGLGQKVVALQFWQLAPLRVERQLQVAVLM